MNQFGLLVVGHHLHAIRQAGLHLLDFLVKPLDHLGGILAKQFQNHARNHFALSVAGDDATADFVAVVDIGDIRQQDGRAGPDLDRDGANILQAFHHADAAHKVFLAAQHQELTTHVAIVLVDRFDQALKRQVILPQLVGVDPDLVLENVPADGQNLGHSGDGLQLELHHPVVEFAQPGVHWFAFGVDLVRIRSQIVDEDLPQPRRNGAQGGWLVHFGQLGGRASQAFRHQLPGKIDVHVVLEIHIHHRHAEGGGRLDLRHPRKPVHGRLDRVGDKAFDFLRRHTVPFGEHRHHDGRNVRERVHWHPLILIYACAD